MSNIYLTGMMGCGKTAIGYRAAKKTARKFLDIDACIEKEAGSTIAHIFERLGEEEFRKMETDMLRRIAKQETDAIVSCGGGIVLADENIELMKQSGVIVYVERDINAITKQMDMKNRPVLQANRDNISKVFQKRQVRYESSCDFRFPNETTVDAAVNSLVALLQL